MKHIVLIGFMGAGKTTVGRRLAEKTNRRLLDTDQIIEQQAGCSISEIFAQKGEAYFRGLEQQVLEQLAEDPEPAVISTGGGMPAFAPNRPLLKKLGTVIYLRVQPETVWERLKGDTTRPLLAGEDGPQKVRTLLAAREPLYQETAHLVVSVDGRSIREIVTEIYRKTGA